MPLILTATDVDLSLLGDEILKIPRLEFSTEGNDYWVLLPFFEKIEDATGKLIDLGESVSFEADELDLLLEIVDEAIKKVPEPEAELLLQDDNELMLELFEKIRGIIRIATVGKGKLTAQNED